MHRGGLGASAAVDWFALRSGDHVALVPDQADVLRSEAFPGLWLDVPALLAGDAAAIDRTLQVGISESCGPR